MRRKEVANQEQQLAMAMKSYKKAVEVGNRKEEARWSNFIANIYKNLGEYVKALKWIRKDYKVSKEHLHEKQLLATCQSIGEIYLLLQKHEDALKYQKEHLKIATDANDLIEQQRASTQLGRTYHEIFLKSDHDHSSLRNAKKYFKSSMKLAQTIRDRAVSKKHAFIKEYIDAHNNLGMIEIDLDNFTEAEKILIEGLSICDEEEVAEYDDARTRLHHNLGNVYMELRKWVEAREHIEKDIEICRNIGHCQGEAKGYINLGELYYRDQKYDKAISSYRKAFDLATSLEDEDALAIQIEENIDTVKEAEKVLDELKKERQNLKKLDRNREKARGTDSERKCLHELNASLDKLIEKSRMILAWTELGSYAKKKMSITEELCDEGKLSDSFSVIGESYHKLRNFRKALESHKKAFEICKSIGHLEGQALSKINIGNALDSIGDHMGALVVFNEAYRIADGANFHSVKLLALENIHYSHMIRFDDVEEAIGTKLLIDQLKQSIGGGIKVEDPLVDWCSETEMELDNHSSDNKTDCSSSSKSSELNSLRPKSIDTVGEWDETVPLRSLLQSSKQHTRKRATNGVAFDASRPCPSPNQRTSRPTGSLAVNRKRTRIILSDDDDEDEDKNEEVYCSDWMIAKSPAECTTSSDKLSRKYTSTPAREVQVVQPFPSRCVNASKSDTVETSISSYKSRSFLLDEQDVKRSKFTGACSAVGDSDNRGNNITTSIGSCSLFQDEISTRKAHASCEDHCQCIIFRVDEDFVHMNRHVGNKLSLEQIKVELACLYYLRLPKQKRSRGLLPVIQHVMHGGRIFESLNDLYSIKEHSGGNTWIDVSISEMVLKHVMKLYMDCCDELSEPPSMEVIMKLYNLEVPDDEIIVSDCKLQDISVAPLLNALQRCKRIAALDLSHNQLGNETVEKLKEVFLSSGQSHGGLVLNLHSNRLGQTALYYISQCPAIYARLEVLNISGNRLTDNCASYISTILQTFKALYSLDLENCSIASRTIDAIAVSLNSESVLSHLSLGYNDLIAGNALTHLLKKLATLRRFQELNLNGIKLSKNVVDGLCQFAKGCCLSGLMLGNTNIGTESGMQLIKALSTDAPELTKFDLSYCELKCEFVVTLSNKFALINSLYELNLSGNSILEEGGNALATLLSRPECNLRVLEVSKCKLGLIGIVRVIQALSTNSSLQELNLAENVSLNETLTDSKGPTDSEMFELETNENQLEVADSEEILVTKFGVEDVCSSQKRICFLESELMEELFASIKKANELKLLDVSNNGFSKGVMETLFSSWVFSRGDLAERHFEEKIVHLYVKGLKCCGVKSCCRRI